MILFPDYSLRVAKAQKKKIDEFDETRYVKDNNADMHLYASSHPSFRRMKRG